MSKLFTIEEHEKNMRALLSNGGPGKDRKNLLDKLLGKVPAVPKRKVPRA